MVILGFTVLCAWLCYHSVKVAEAARKARRVPRKK